MISEINAFKLKTLNIMVIIFTLILTIVSLGTFFVCVYIGKIYFAYYISGTYILCMLLAVPTLKGFLEKIESLALKKINFLTLIFVFFSILLIAVITMLALTGSYENF